MQSSLQHLEGLMRKAMQLYHLVEEGDRICIGVSGGKDSVALTLGLAHLTRYFEHPFQIHALTLDPCFGGRQTDYSPIATLFAQNNIPYTIERTNIGEVVFDIRREKTPCALCANLRRGTLHTKAKELGCNKVALGHHLDDAVETFYMNLFGEGRIGCFAPKTYLSRQDITLIRPMVLATEQEVIAAVRSAGLPIVKSACPADGVTQRSVTKDFVTQRALQDPAFREKTLGAMQKAGMDGWGI